LTQGANLRNPRTKYQRSKIAFAVTSIALSLSRIGPRLLQLPAQSLIGSTGTLDRVWYQDDVRSPNIILDKIAQE